MSEQTKTPLTDAECKKLPLFTPYGVEAAKPNEPGHFVRADFARTLELRCAELTARVAELEASLAEATKKQPINTSLRLFDLVRYARAVLHEDGLITDSEYGELCAGPMAMSPKGGSPSRQRLEDYDELRAQLTEARKDGQRIDKVIANLWDVSFRRGLWNILEQEGMCQTGIAHAPTLRAAIDAATPLPEKEASA